MVTIRCPAGSPFSGTIRLRRLGKEGVFTIKSLVKWRRSRLYKIRHEFETTIKEHRTFDFILKELGFEPLFTKEKIRAMYMWKDAKVSIDKLPFIGNYIEIEAPKNRIRELSALLNLDISKGITETYIELFSAYKRLYKKPDLELAFSKKTR